MTKCNEITQEESYYISDLCTCVYVCVAIDYYTGPIVDSKMTSTVHLIDGQLNVVDAYACAALCSSVLACRSFDFSYDFQYCALYNITSASESVTSQPGFMHYDRGVCLSVSC